MRTQTWLLMLLGAFVGVSCGGSGPTATAPTTTREPTNTGSPSTTASTTTAAPTTTTIAPAFSGTAQNRDGFRYEITFYWDAPSVSIVSDCFGPTPPGRTNLPFRYEVKNLNDRPAPFDAPSVGSNVNEAGDALRTQAPANEARVEVIGHSGCTFADSYASFPTQDAGATFRGRGAIFGVREDQINKVVAYLGLTGVGPNSVPYRAPSG